MNNNERTIRAAIYTRISDDRTGARLGVTRQLEDCTALAKRLGMVVVATFDDNDISAYSGKTRPAFEEMLKAMKRDEFDALITWHTDRLYRSMKDLERLIDIAEANQVILRAVQGGDLDLSTSTGRMMARIMGSVSRAESEHKGERQRRAAQQKAEAGRPSWKRAFGYLEGLEGPEPNPACAPLVKEAYSALLAGASLKDIAKLFNDAGAYGLTGKPWGQKTVSLFMRRARNAALREYQGELMLTDEGAPVQGTWAPLVDEETWNAAQAILSAPSRTPGRKSVQKHILTGVLNCGKCGHHLSGQITGDKRRVAYICRGCWGTSIRADHVEPFVIGALTGRLAQDDAIDMLAAEHHDAGEAETIRIEVATLHARLDQLAQDYGEGLMTGRQMKIASDLIAGKLAKLQARQLDATKTKVFSGIPLGTPGVAAVIAGLSPDRLRAVLDVLMTVTVQPVGSRGHAFNPDRITIEWR